jgi:hypothetical protein
MAGTTSQALFLILSQKSPKVQEELSSFPLNYFMLIIFYYWQY